jgi:uncharacterized membrane protein
MLSLLLALHVVAAVAWVGGIFFAFMALRPAAMALEPPLRVALWQRAFTRFFPWVWVFVLTLLVTGHALMGFGLRGTHVLLMMAGGWIMALLYVYLYFGPYQRLSAAVAAQDVPAAAAALGAARPIMAINLLLGLAISAIAAGGRLL